MPTTRTNIWRVQQSRRADFQRLVEFKDSDGVTQTVADWTFEGALRSDRGSAVDVAAFDFVVTTDRDGNADRAVAISLSAATLTGVPAGDYVGDLFCIDSGGFRNRFVRGEFSIE